MQYMHTTRLYATRKAHVKSHGVRRERQNGHASFTPSVRAGKQHGRTVQWTGGENGRMAKRRRGAGRSTSPPMWGRAPEKRLSDCLCVCGMSSEAVEEVGLVIDAQR